MWQVRNLVGDDLFSRYDRLLLQNTLDSMPGVFPFQHVLVTLMTILWLSWLLWWCRKGRCHYVLLVSVPLRCGLLSPTFLRFCCHTREIRQRGHVLRVWLCLLRRLQKDVSWNGWVPGTNKHQRADREQPTERGSTAAEVKRCVCFVISLTDFCRIKSYFSVDQQFIDQKLVSAAETHQRSIFHFFSEAQYFPFQPKTTP